MSDLHRAAYADVRGRVEALVDQSDGHAPVAACPGWTVRDVVSHLAGLCEDWVSGRLDGYATHTWTAEQVQRFHGIHIEGIISRWRDAHEAFDALPDHAVTGPPARWAFGDAVVHEGDIRGALGASRVPAEAVLLGLKGSIARWRETLGSAAVAPLLVRAPDAREWWVGEPDDGHSTVEVPAYELFRALAGRRSRAQIAGWAWSADPTPYLDAGLPYPFRPAANAIND